MSGLSGLGWSGIRVVPLGVDAVRDCPVFVDFDEGSGGGRSRASRFGEMRTLLVRRQATRAKVGSEITAASTATKITGWTATCWLDLPRFRGGVRA